jgi:hypothetical protein
MLGKAGASSPLVVTDIQQDEWIFICSRVRPEDGICIYASYLELHVRHYKEIVVTLTNATTEAARKTHKDTGTTFLSR